MKIKTVFVFCIIYALSFAGRTHKNTPEKSHLNEQGMDVKIKSVPSLGFTNKTGSCFGESQLKSLISFLNKASSLYRSDLKQNLKYIQENMDASFGTQNERYNVFIQDNYTYVSQYLIHPAGEGECDFVTLTYGINLINPQWSYLVFKYRYSYPPAFQYAAPKGQGSGVSAETKTKISDIINDKQKYLFECHCRALTDLVEQMKSYDGQKWSIVCYNGIFTQGYLAVKNDQWIGIKPYQCQYLLYVQ